MKNLFVFLLTHFFQSISFAQLARPLDMEMTRLDADIAVVLPGYSIDEYPIWSPQNDYIGINILGTWKKVGITETYMVAADWPYKLVASYNYNGVPEPMTREEVEEYKAVTNWDPSKIKAPDGTVYEIAASGFGTRFTISPAVGEQRVIWPQSSGVYHSPSLSPDGRFLAFISETNGLMVFATDKIALAQTTGAAELQINEVISCIEKAKYDKAIKLLDAIISEFPDHPEAYSLKGQVMYRFQGLNRQAETFLLDAIRLAPERLMYVYIVAEYYAYLKKHDQAIASMLTFIEQRPHHVYVYFELGLLYEEIEDYVNACAMYQKMEAYNPGSAADKIEQTCGTK